MKIRDRIKFYIDFLKIQLGKDLITSTTLDNKITVYMEKSDIVNIIELLEYTKKKRYSKDQIAQILGYKDFDHLMLNSDSFERLDRAAVNLCYLLCGYTKPLEELEI